MHKTDESKKVLKEDVNEVTRKQEEKKNKYSIKTNTHKLHVDIIESIQNSIIFIQS